MIEGAKLALPMPFCFSENKLNIDILFFYKYNVITISALDKKATTVVKQHCCVEKQRNV
jgi:hypothetical protein